MQRRTKQKENQTITTPVAKHQEGKRIGVTTTKRNDCSFEGSASS